MAQLTTTSIPQERETWLEVRTYSDPKPVQCRIWIVKEEDGGFSVHAPELPGVVSQAESIDEAEIRIREALEGAIGAYRSRPGGLIPWRRNEDPDESLPPHTAERWIVVDG